MTIHNPLQIKYWKEKNFLTTEYICQFLYASHIKDEQENPNTTQNLATNKTGNDSLEETLSY